MINKHLRREIVRMVYENRDGHIPSAFSIVDIIELLYRSYLKFDPKNPLWPGRDYFILSKGHGCLALYVVLKERSILTDEHLRMFCTSKGILGEHPDCTKVPGVEASTGSLGHGLSMAVGMALGLRIQNKSNRIFVLVGDGECHEGTVWEAANVSNNLQLGNLAVIVDWNGSAAQLMPRDDLEAKWKAFGWNTMVVNGHSQEELNQAFEKISFEPTGAPTVILAKTVKGKGVEMLEGHGTWHHRIPTEQEVKMIMEVLV